MAKLNYGETGIDNLGIEEDKRESLVATEPDEELLDDVGEDEISSEQFLQFLSHMQDILPESENETFESESDMDADDYHNKAVDYVRKGRYHEAIKLCQEGLEKFALNVDLLADTIKYSSKAGDMQNAADYYSLLRNKVPFPQWNWRAYSFVLDYLLMVDPIANEDECRYILENYKQYLPYEEKAVMAESELESALGNAEVSMQVLKEAVRIYSNASQCALRLADMQMDRGLYEEVLTTANYGIAASAEVQPSINIPYLFLLRSLAKDHLLHKKEYEGEEISCKEVEALKNEYELLLKSFPDLLCYSGNITMRVKMLDFVKVD